MAQSLEEAEHLLRQLVKERMAEPGLTDEQRHHRVALVVGNWLGLDRAVVADVSDALKDAVSHVARSWRGGGDTEHTERYCALGFLLGTMRAEIERVKGSAG